MTDDAQTPAPTPIEVPAELAAIAADAPADAAPAASPEAEAVKAEARQRRLVLLNWLEKMSATLLKLGDGALLTRPAENYFWEQTGFLVEDGKVFAKFGNKPFQPIGLIEDDGFYPTEGSKLLWAHDFAIVKLLPFVGAFKVQRKAVVVEDEKNPARLTDAEREAMITSMTMLQGEMQRFLESADENALKENAERLIDTVKLASLQCPRLDDRLKLFAMQNPELNSAEGKLDLAKAEPRSLVAVCIEYLRMKINDDGMRRHFEQNELVPSDAQDTSAQVLIDGLLERLTSLMPANPKDEWDPDAIRMALEGAGVVYAPLREVLKPFIGTSDVLGALRAALDFITAEKAKAGAPAAG